MFSKKFLSKNLIAFIALVFVGVLFVAPHFLNENKTNDAPASQTESQKETSQVADQQSDSLTTQGEQEKDLPASSPQVQSSTTQQTTPKKTVNPNPSTPTQNQPAEQPVPVVRQVTLNIEAGSYGNYSYKVTWTSNMSVWDVLDKARNENGFSVNAVWNNAFNSYYVKGIHGNNCECWEYKVNDTKPSVGASVTKVNENDIITWKST